MTQTAAAVPWGRLLPEARQEAAGIVDAACVRLWLGEVAARLEAERDFLTQLDAAIGDADHGVNMHRGFTAVMTKIAGIEPATPGQLLKTTGRTFVSTVGGAAGPLYGTAFLQAGEVLGDHETFGPRLLLDALRASLEGVQRIGAASVGDKTMVDALSPALRAFELELRMGGSLETAATGAREAAAEGMRATIPLQARKGRASYLGPRSVGHQDPGATSTALMFAALAHAVLADRSQRFAG
ncbi:MAG TPA: dihydroxyacetone kinase subunit DhaL, partial [Actinomycetota bacterium]